MRLGSGVTVFERAKKGYKGRMMDDCRKPCVRASKRRPKRGRLRTYREPGTTRRAFSPVRVLRESNVVLQTFLAVHMA